MQSLDAVDFLVVSKLGEFKVMFRLRLGTLMVTAVAAIALSAVTAGAASAAVFTLGTEVCNGAIANLCWVNASKEVLELTGEQTVTVAKKTGSANGIFKGIIGEEKFTIECEAVKQGKGTNVIKQAAPLTTSGTITGTLNFEKCKLTAPAALAKKCVIPVEKETLALTGTLLNINELKLVPTAGETAPFIQLTFANNGTETCPATFKTGEHAVTGTQVLTVLNPSTAEATKSGSAVAKSGLKLAGNAAELTGEVTLSFTGLEDNVVTALA